MSAAAARVLSGLLEARTGQVLSPARSWRIETAMKPLLRKLDLADTDALVAKIAKGGDPSLANRAVEALLNNESSFYRDLPVFQLIDHKALATLADLRKRERRLRIWSAGCSTGQEAYSLAMLLRDAGARWKGWTFDITGTDISASAVARARAGRFTQFEIQRGLPARAMLRWFTQEDEDWQADPSLRHMIRFSTHNLFDPPPGVFDLILCRNVLMYFAVPSRTLVMERLAGALDTGGLLVLGAGETVIGQTTRFVSHPAMRGLYARSEDLATPALARTA